jgi:plasmid stabilization system protein ParE
MKIRFLTLAQQELDDAVAWYESQQPGLGLQFLNEIDRTIKRIVIYPKSCAEIEDGIRRCLIKRFPYGVIYGIEHDTVIIIAVSHLHRKPRYWYRRITSIDT